MAPDFANMEEKLAAHDGPLDMLRSNEQRPLSLPVLPDVETNVFEEQRAWRETCAFFDQSHHMSDLVVSGPDAVDLFARVGVNSFEGFAPGQAKQLVMCNPEGYYIGDGILSYVDEDRLRFVAPTFWVNWIRFNESRGDFDVDVVFDPNTPARGGEPPESFRYEVMGPNAIPLVEELTDDDVASIPFFNLDRVTIDGREVTALQHTMGGEGGVELWGPGEHAAAVEDAIMDAGEDHGLRRLGTKTYRSTACFSGWVHLALPAVYGDSMRAYREWLDDDDLAATLSLSGSYYADDVTDYYMTPADLGLSRHVAFDHDFVGRAGLERLLADPPRELVMLVWDGEDVVDGYATLFESGDPHKFVELLDPSWGAAHYDEVRAGGELVGVSKWPVYNTNERAILSLAAVDTALADPGTDVTLRWGIPDGEPRPANVERHVQTEVGATVYDVESYRDQHR